MKVREGGQVVKVAAMVATCVNADGYREVLGIHTATNESGAGWLAFFRACRTVLAHEVEEDVFVRQRHAEPFRVDGTRDRHNGYGHC